VSGICGLFNLDGAPVTTDELGSMTSLLERRGPEGTGLWVEDAVGLGHTLLATTPEAVHERLPLRHAESGCVITADVRLDNREELLPLLDLEGHTGIGGTGIGDAEIVLHAYLAWGEACVERFLGDFVFAIWDPGEQRLFCARDHMGMKPFYYHHSPRRFFAFASEPRAILVLPQTPYRINEGRIADYLVNPLEGIDKTSTFFQEVYRLPPAHTVTVGPGGVRLRRYWRLEPGDELRLSSDDEYAEAFLEVFTEAVRCRLRGAGPVASMLSGGIDSGSVVAVASSLLADAGEGPLSTFSAVAPDPSTCLETRTIHLAASIDGLSPTMISYAELDSVEDLEHHIWDLAEPFDAWMALQTVLYLAARRSGHVVLLDGVAGDVVLGERDHLTRLLRSGRWLTAYREASGQNEFWGGAYPPKRDIARRLGSIVAPPLVKRSRRQLRQRGAAMARATEGTLIRQEFASEVQLEERLATLRSHSDTSPKAGYRQRRAVSIEHPFLTVGRERYDRVASAVGVEPRDPFTDRRLLALAVGLPGEQLLSGGYPKAILRRTMQSHLPDEVRWRRGKEHLGSDFVDRAAAGKPAVEDRFRALGEHIERYVDLDRIADLADGPRSARSMSYDAAQLATWISRQRER
jgi:asparagine synthase (glutamine-hydrolysing)